MASVQFLKSTRPLMERLSLISRVLTPSLVAKSAYFFRLLPTMTKYLIFLLFFINIRSWPLLWHFRVFRPVVRLQILHKLLLPWRTMFKSRAGKILSEDAWFDSVSPVGADPFNYSITYKTWASIDDSDFNGHLSNSSYAKTLDSARFKAALSMFVTFFRTGGRMALAGTHYNFIREIPTFASYEVRISIASWDHKWIYLLTKFVSKSPRKNKPKTRPNTSSPSSPGDALISSTVWISTDGGDISSAASTPLPSASTPPVNGTHTPEMSKALNAVAASLVSSSSPMTGEEPDGATLHAVGISQLCFKVGRISVPPALVLSVCGFSAPPPTMAGSPTTYSPTNPPPHWAQAKRVVSLPVGGSTKKLRALFTGGWKDVPEGRGRWWEDAMRGVEKERLKRLEVVKKLTEGMKGVRELDLH